MNFSGLFQNDPPSRQGNMAQVLGFTMDESVDDLKIWIFHHGLCHELQHRLCPIILSLRSPLFFLYKNNRSLPLKIKKKNNNKKSSWALIFRGTLPMTSRATGIGSSSGLASHSWQKFGRGGKLLGSFPEGRGSEPQRSAPLGRVTTCCAQAELGGRRCFQGRASFPLPSGWRLFTHQVHAVGKWVWGEKKEKEKGPSRLRKSYFAAQTPIVLFTRLVPPKYMWCSWGARRRFWPHVFFSSPQATQLNCAEFLVTWEKHSRALSRKGKRLRSDFLFYIIPKEQSNSSCVSVCVCVRDQDTAIYRRSKLYPDR